MKIYNHEDKPVIEGHLLTLACMAKGSESMTFTWFKEEFKVSLYRLWARGQNGAFGTKRVKWTGPNYFDRLCTRVLIWNTLGCSLQTHDCNWCPDLAPKSDLAHRLIRLWHHSRGLYTVKSGSFFLVINSNYKIRNTCGQSSQPSFIIPDITRLLLPTVFHIKMIRKSYHGTTNN